MDGWDRVRIGACMPYVHREMLDPRMVFVSATVIAVAALALSVFGPVGISDNLDALPPCIRGHLPPLLAVVPLPERRTTESGTHPAAGPDHAGLYRVLSRHVPLSRGVLDVRTEHCRSRGNCERISQCCSGGRDMQFAGSLRGLSASQAPPSRRGGRCEAGSMATVERSARLRPRRVESVRPWASAICARATRRMRAVHEARTAGVSLDRLIRQAVTWCIAVNGHYINVAPPPGRASPIRARSCP